MFNASAGQTEPFLNLFLRQQIPHWRFLPGGHMEAVVDLRNLLAQGYVPMIGPGRQDGLPGAVGAQRARRRVVHLLTTNFRESSLRQ